MANLSTMQALALSRLKRARRWVEILRTEELVEVEGIRDNGQREIQTIALKPLLELIALGLAECDASPRLHEPFPHEVRQGAREVMVKYWRAVDVP